MRQSWTTAEIIELEKDYSILTQEQLQAKYHRSERAIQLKAFKLGLIRKPSRLRTLPVAEILADSKILTLPEILNKYALAQTTYYRFLKKHKGPTYQHYTEEEKEYLKQRYSTASWSELTAKLNRSVEVIKNYATATLGLARSAEVIPKKQSKLPLSPGEIVTAYSLGWSSPQIAKVCGINSHRWIRTILERNNTPRRELTDAFRKYQLNVDYFETINTHAKAYFLGLMAADGCNREEYYALSIALQECDKHILDSFIQELQTDHTLRFVPHDGKENMWQFSFNCKKMSEDLAKHGIVSRKSLILQFPTTVPDEFMPSFVRGFMDGDGMIYANSKLKKYNVNFASTQEFLLGLREAINRCTQLNWLPNLYHITDKNTWQIYYARKHETVKLLNWIYSPGPPYLSRKYNKYQQVLEIYNQNNQ